MYCTKFILEVRNIKNEKEYNKLLEYLTEKDLMGYAFEKGAYIDFTHEAVFCPFEEVEWKDHAAVMVVMSEKFPKMTFELTGDGQSYGDLWKEYYHDGKVECCSGDIIYEQPKKIQWNELVNF